jgi:hypothetical protein
MSAQGTGARHRTEHEGSAWRVLLACAAVGLGGLLLGVQFTSSGELVGTGYQGLGMGVLVALVALVYVATEGLRDGVPGFAPIAMPRGWLATLSSAVGYLGLVFLVAGVLVPGGPWMFAETLVLAVVLSRTAVARADGPGVGRGTVLLLALMLLFRLWVTWRGCQEQWSAASIDVPLLSGISALPESLRTVSFGEFSAREFGIPEEGLVFARTMTVWALGFALCAGGLWLRQRSSWELENDRVHDTIGELPPELARLVERLLPEEEWRQLGLHHLSDRQRKKRISALTEERLRRTAELRDAWRTARGPELTGGDEFAREIQGLLGPGGEPGGGA